MAYIGGQIYKKWFVWCHYFCGRDEYYLVHNSKIKLKLPNWLGRLLTKQEAAA